MNTCKPSSLHIYRDSYLVKTLPVSLPDVTRTDFDRLETALRLYDAAAKPSRRISVSAYFLHDTDLTLHVSLIEGTRAVGLLTKGTLREAILICDALGYAETLNQSNEENQS